MAKTILIIEDDKDILDMIAYILLDDGFEVVRSQDNVSTGFVCGIAPALILLDNRLADGFGSDLCLKLKNDPSTCHIPVLLVSATEQLSKVAGDSGADGFLDKPFDLSDLVAIVRKFC